MNMMKNVITQPKPMPPKGIIYGAPEVGKTTFAAHAPCSLIIDCEQGANVQSSARTPYLQTWGEIHQWLKSVETDKHDYNIIVIDTIDWLLRRIEEHVSGCSNGKAESTLNRSHGGYGNGKQVLRNYVYQILLPLFDRIINRRCAVVLLAHMKKTEIQNDDGTVIEKIAPKIHDDLLSTIIEWSDFVCLAHKKDDGQRILITQNNQRALAKNRYGLRSPLKFEWESFASAIGDRLNNIFKTDKKEGVKNG